LPIKDTEARRSYNSKYSKKWYIKNKTKKKEQAKKSRKRVVRRNRKYVEKHKLLHPCPCGEKEPCCLSFHHYEGNKEGNISDMVNRGYSLKRIQTEINKCKVMCLNCHAKLHKKEKMLEEKILKETIIKNNEVNYNHGT